MFSWLYHFPMFTTNNNLTSPSNNFLPYFLGYILFPYLLQIIIPPLHLTTFFQVFSWLYPFPLCVASITPFSTIPCFLHLTSYNPKPGHTHASINIQGFQQIFTQPNFASLRRGYKVFISISRLLTFLFGELLTLYLYYFPWSLQAYFPTTYTSITLCHTPKSPSHSIFDGTTFPSTSWFFYFHKRANLYFLFLGLTTTLSNFFFFCIPIY